MVTHMSYDFCNGSCEINRCLNDKRNSKIEASKLTPQYVFRKGLELFGDEGFYAAKNELEVNLLGRGYIDILSWKDITRDIRKQVMGYLKFLKRKRSGKMKGRGCAGK